ncbi:putative homeodomain protein [Butyriboletus roseoflavus]|nr:putative homeodomain protein [Butyriboletus roseoflavus]
MNDDLIQQLTFAETNFLDAFQKGPQMLDSYQQTLSTLLDLISTATETGNIGPETLSLAHSVASRISNVASCFLDIRRGENRFTAQLQRDCDAMLHQMAGLDLNAQPKSSLPSGSPLSPICSNTPTPSADSSSPFLTSAYQWLLNNLHNPYPTAEVKTRMAAASSCQVSSVNSWFLNARRRIGWTTLCRERFSNCRADMIDAAYRALVEEDPQRPLPPELIHSFVAMKVAAEGLYSSIFTRSAFAGDLDGIVLDMTEEDREHIEVGKCPQVEQAKLTKVRDNQTRRGSHRNNKENLQTIRDSYPSPDQSIAASPVPALVDSTTDESEEEEDVVPPIVAGSKRRRSTIESVNQPSYSVRRPIKRLRASTTSRTHIPSPPSSTDGVDAPSHDGSPELSPVHSPQPETNNLLPSRKRRLSDTDVNGIPKRPRGSLAAPRLHIASDPLPYPTMENEYSIDDWFNTNFDALFAIPPPVDATEPDFSASWEVELFRDYSIPGNPKHAPKCPPASAVDTQISVPTDLSDLDSLLQSLGSDTFATPPESVLPTDVNGAPYTTSFDSSIPDMSQINIDWTSLLNGADTYQPTVYSTFSQYPADSQPLPEIDLSMLQLPQVLPSVNSPGDFASKQTKLHQLHAMQEAVRRMEQELQAEGVVM